MKKLIFSFALLLGLAACASAGVPPTRTAAPAATTPSPTISPLPTKTQLPIVSPTLEASLTPTEVAINFTHGLALRPEQAIFVPMDKMNDIVASVLREPALLKPDAPIAKPTLIVDDGSGNSHFLMDCPVGSCAIAATIKTQDEGIEPDFILWMIMTANGPKPFWDYAYDPIQHNGFGGWNRLQLKPSGPYSREYIVSLGDAGKAEYPYGATFVIQLDRQSIIDWHNTGIMPPSIDASTQQPNSQPVILDGSGG